MAFTSLLAASTLLVASVVADLPSCPANSPVSCSTNNIQNTCCTETQGQVVSVQLWDTNPATGPADHWTIHGLWPGAFTLAAVQLFRIKSLI
jgi:ribonuclease T2